MKKLLAVLLALAMLFSFAACGEDTPEKPDNTKQPTANSDAAIEASLFTVEFDGEWINIEDEFEDDEDYCVAVLQILDPEDEEYYLIEAKIKAEIEEPYDFREDLVYYGFNQYEYKVNNAYETVKVGGVDLLKYDDGDDTLVYFNRVENANANADAEKNRLELQVI